MFKVVIMKQQIRMCTNQNPAMRMPIIPSMEPGVFKMVSLFDVLDASSFTPYLQHGRNLYENYPYVAYGWAILAMLILLAICCRKRTVNCWFCNTNSVTKFSQRNSWTCAACGQYNGFTHSGDYNIKLNEMSDGSLNENKGKAVPGVAEHNDFPNAVAQQVQLCNVCNRNQLLKVKHFSKFEPIVEKNFDEEFKDFKDKLEDLYALCKSCDKGMKRHVKSQDTIIRGNLKNLGFLRTIRPDYGDVDFEDEYTTFDTVQVIIGACMVIFTIIRTMLEVLCWVTDDNAIANGATKDNVLIFLQRCFSNFDLVVMREFNSALLIFGVLWSLFIIGFTSRHAENYCCVCYWVMSTGLSFLDNHTYLPFTPELLSDNYALLVTRMFLSFCIAVKLIICSFRAYTHIKASRRKQIISTKQRFNYEKLKSSKSHKGRNSKPKNESCFSDDDCSKSDSEEVNHPIVRKRQKRASGINGSLNALHLNDKAGGDRQSMFKQPLLQSSENVVAASLYYTPPPSRSSSLLSLETQPNLSHSNLLFTNNNRTSIEKSDKKLLGTDTGQRSFYSHSKTRIGHQSLFGNSAYQPLTQKSSISQHKPLITPAKLNHSKLDNRRHSKKSSPFMPNESTHTSKSWEHRLEGDVTIHDSVSQVGLRRSNFDISDDEDQPPFTPVRCRPRTSTHQSSSPRSIVSTISRITSQGAEKVENSRLLRWFLGICIIVNFILAIFMAIDVRNKRYEEGLNNIAKL